jgi:hypothetical protein
MTDKSKKTFFILSVVVPIALYCVYYYGMMIKNAPYRYSDFKSIRFEYGLGDSMVNKYNSETGAYQYKTRNGNIKKLTVYLSKDDMLYLHRKAADLGFWNFPPEAKGDATGDKTMKSPRYLIEFVYKEKSKKVVFDQSYNDDNKLNDANMRLIKEIQSAIDRAEERSGK